MSKDKPINTNVERGSQSIQKKFSQSHAQRQTHPTVSVQTNLNPPTPPKSISLSPQTNNPGTQAND